MAASSSSSPGSDTDPEVAREKWYTSASALSIGLVCLVFGVPLWWKTTDVYRADLPYSNIKGLAASRLSITLNVELVLVDVGSKIDQQRFTQLVSSTLEDDDSSKDVLSISFIVSTRAAETAERSALNSQDSTLNRIEELLSHKGIPGNYLFYVLPEHLLPDSSLPLIGSRRNAFLRYSDDLLNMVTSIKTILDAAVNKASLLKSLEVAAGHSATEKADKDHVRAVQASQSYDVIFSLLVPDPGLVNVKWNFKKAKDDYLAPLEDMLAEYATLNFKSQVLYYTGLAVVPKQDNVTGERYLLSTDLPHLINPVESKLGSFVTKTPALNFLVYVPRPTERPLFIRTPTGERAEVNSFLSPRWGGFYICDETALVRASTQGSTEEVDVHLKVVFEVLLPQLRSLLGIQQVLPSGVGVMPAGSQIITTWELDNWLRGRTVENLARCIGTLDSLTQLVDQIRNMVINDDVGREVARAVAAAQRSLSELSSANLASAFIESVKAVRSSERAFFDESLLELLYFPEDQKFAIYIPLFLPIGLPILMSTMSALKWCYRRQAKEKTD